MANIGTLITLDLDFTNASSLPKVITKDPLEAPGSLLLIDATHPLGAWAAGVPAELSSLPNIFKTEAAAITGAAVTTLDSTVRSVGLTGVDGKLERTPLGGVHAIQSASMPSPIGKGFQAQIPLGIIAHIKANPTHNYYFSHWAKPTRVGTASIDAFGGAIETATDSYLFTLGTFSSGSTQLGKRNGTRGTAGTAMLRNSGNTSPAASFTTLPTTTGSKYSIFELGNFLACNGSAPTHGAHVFYRGYIEDLTISGRTYGEVDALDYAQFTKECMTAGGRYYGDTVPTDPATIP